MPGPTGPVTPIRAGIFGAVCAAIIGAIVYGRVKPVETPRPAHWPGVMVLCVEPHAGSIAVDDAVQWWRDRGFLIALSCIGAGATLDVDPTIDTRSSADDEGTTHGLTEVQARGGLIVSATIRILPGSDALTVAHEIGHALGYQHPQVAPSGVMMHPFRPGWDGRGLHGP